MSPEGFPPRPPEVDWTLPASAQASFIVEAVRSGGLERAVDWPTAEDLRFEGTTQRLAGAFQDTVTPWRAVPARKLQHPFGVVGLHRLEITGGSFTGLLRKGMASPCVARWSIAADPAMATRDDDPLFPMIGLALKFPTWNGPAVDLLAVSRYGASKTVLGALQTPITTHTLDPRTLQRPPEPGEFLVGAMLNRFERTLEVVGADTDSVTATRLPVDSLATRDAWGSRYTEPRWPESLSFTVTQQAQAWLQEQVEQGADEDFTAWSPDVWEELIGRLDDGALAVVRAEVSDDEGEQSEIIGRLRLVGSLAPGPVGDHWLHFQHPMRGH